jgi:hypothetical protein
MRTRVFSAALMGIVAASFGFSQSAMAVTLSDTPFTVPPAAFPLPSVFATSIPTPVSTTGTYTPFLTGAVSSSPGVYRSPFENDTVAGTVALAYQTIPFTVVGAAGDVTASTALYTFGGAGRTSLTAWWGSPDSTNRISFYASSDGTGGALASYTGNDLLNHTTGADLVVFSFLDVGDQPFHSVVVRSNPGGPVFEFATLAGSEVPLPAAWPLFGTGIGLLAYLGRRRKKSRATDDAVAAEAVA